MSNTVHEGVLMVRGKGTGFFSIDDETEDVVISREHLNFALNGDTVAIELLPQIPGERQAGKVTKVLEPSHKEFIGVIKERSAGGQAEYYLSPDNHRIHIRPLLPDAHKHDLGMKVVVEIKSWSQPHLDPVGEVIETLGKAGDHETEMQAIIRSGGFSENFPEEIAQAAQALHMDQAKIFKDALADPKRKDIRNITTFTIDPADAKDFDDALSYEKLENGNHSIGIHIADVSHYVEDGGIIDMEARERGTSIYLVDRVIPMLPEVLSNDLCSLRPNEDRLAFSAVFEITPEAAIVNEWYGQTVIHSDRRFSYEEAQEILDTAAGDLQSELATIMELSRILRKQRLKDGAIAFEQPEVKFRLDENGTPIEVYTKIRTETMLMIEDFMLLANRLVATHVNELAKKAGREAAFVYRIHDVPDPDRIEELTAFIHALGYEFKTENGQVNSKTINKLLKDLEGKPEENLLNVAIIRSMAKAVYSTQNIGHFSLAFAYYGHFTSPIRRYPDLMVHRLLRRQLDGEAITGKELAKFEKLARQSSERELVAVRAERDSVKYKQVEYMAPHVGETFTGVITGVSDWGIYAEEKASKSEGMIRLSSIKGDFFEHEAAKYRVRGKKTGKVYRLGDEIQIKVIRADLEEKQLDFEIVK